MRRNVLINGTVYTDHELKSYEVIIGENVLPHVQSTYDGLEEPLSTFHTIPFEDGMTAARAEELTWTLPFFDEYVDANTILDEVLDILTDEQAEQIPGAFHEWKPGIDYNLGDRMRYNLLLYKCVTAHTSQVGWEPPNAPSLWSRIGEGDIPEWLQPTGAHDAYALGDKVMHNGKKWQSTVDGNIWEPGVYGWDEIGGE